MQFKCFNSKLTIVSLLLKMILLPLPLKYFRLQVTSGSAVFTYKKGRMRSIVFILALLSGVVVLLSSCTNKEVKPEGPYTLSYGDTILYLSPGGNNIIQPTEWREGTYSGFPEGIEIDDNTGAINIGNSETGLRYRITHTAPGGKQTTTKVVLSGITFTDHFYRLSAGDSIANPVYNANISRTLPLAGSVFDEGNLANTSGCSVKTDNGSINLSESVRKGVFGTNPRNDDKKEIEIKYRINDGSGKSLNKLKVLLYWYNTMADVPQYVWDILNERDSQGVFLKAGTDNTITTPAQARVAAVAKPRPPCVIIVAN